MKIMNIIGIVIRLIFDLKSTKFSKYQDDLLEFLITTISVLLFSHCNCFIFVLNQHFLFNTKIDPIHSNVA